jgi:hypothetical protein
MALHAHPAPSVPAHPFGGWEIRNRPGSGLFIVSPSGTLLFRIDPAAGVIYPWCRKTSQEVPIALKDLFTIAPT